MSQCPPGASRLDELPVLASARMEVVFDQEGQWEYVTHPDSFALDCNERIKLDLHQCEVSIHLPNDSQDSWRAFFLNGQLYVVHALDLHDGPMPFDIAQEDRPWVVSLLVTAESGLDVLGKQAH